MAVLAFGFVALPLAKNNKRNALLAVGILVPLFAAGLYMKLGSPSSGDIQPARNPTTMAAARADSKSPAAVGSVASLVDGLAAKLEQNPNDAGSWLLLARSYKHLDRMDEALAAYEKAAQLGQHDEELSALLERNDGTAELAVAGAQVTGRVSLSESAITIVEPDDTVFVFAKAIDGPSMPVAVLRRAVAELPLNFTLNDSMSMTPDIRLSSFPQVIVTARVSRGGDATVALQGLEAQSGVVDVANDQALNLIIE